MSAELELARLEAKVLNTASVKGWLATVDVLRTMLVNESPDIKRVLLALVVPRVESIARAAVVAAFELGVADAAKIVEQAIDKSKIGKPSKSAIAPVKGLDKAGAKALAQAVKLARAESSPETYLAPLFGHANRVRGSVSDAINRAGNEGSTAVADLAGLPTVWVAETDACVHCLAYSGRVAKVGGAFPGGLTYGRKSYHLDAVKTPPRHPRCRCTVEPLRSQEYADALRREADRSVLRGFSLESESMGTRIDAAKRLVASDPDAPKSVIAYAEKAVKVGKFPTRGRPNK